MIHYQLLLVLADHTGAALAPGGPGPGHQLQPVGGDGPGLTPGVADGGPAVPTQGLETQEQG